MNQLLPKTCNMCNTLANLHNDVTMETRPQGISPEMFVSLYKVLDE